MKTISKMNMLVPKLLLGIVLGILIGQFLPVWVCRVFVTVSSLFGVFLKFVIPLMILAYVTKGIADLTQDSGKLLLLTIALAYVSTFAAGTVSFLVSETVFPDFISGENPEQIMEAAENSISPLLNISVPPVFDTITAVALAFLLGLSLSCLRRKKAGNTLYSGIKELSSVIDLVLGKAIIPLLPLYILGIFTELTHTGKTFAVLGVLWRVFLTVIAMHLVCILIQYMIAGAVSRKNPLRLMANQIPGYAAALGTQSSAATIPVNLQCAQSDGISEEIRNFVVPLCANIHMAGSMITIVACATAVCLMCGIPVSFASVIPFILTLGVAMVASPGAPGGSIMTALPFLFMIFGTELGATDSTPCAIMIALYLTQDSFGTACNVSGDNAIGVIVDSVYRKFLRHG